MPTHSPTTNTQPVGHEGTRVHITEKQPWTGGTGLALGILTLGSVVFIAAITMIIMAAEKMDSAAGSASPAMIAMLIAGIILIPLAVVALSMVRVTSPGHTRVVQLFGRYLGTSRITGLSVVPPLSTTTKVSVRVRNFETNEIKVNDLNGNPVNIGAIIVWQVADTAQATFAVEDMEEFIHSQSESALRHVATTHPYDGGTAKAPSLSGSTELVSQELADEVAARVAVAGLEIIEARISNLSYAPEIAQSMLQRQQAGAIVDARETIVEGAVSMVESALEQLESREIVDLDPERRAAMVSNLLVVLCSDNNAQPVLNTGSLYT